MISQDLHMHTHARQMHLKIQRHIRADSLVVDLDRKHLSGVLLDQGAGLDVIRGAHPKPARAGLWHVS